MAKLTYRDAGLDLEKYEQAMARLPGIMAATHTPRVMDMPGGFAGLFRLGSSKKFAKNYDDPVLVSGTDGVGTKLKVAIAARVYNTVGIDLVAMSVNDVLCLGAEPLFFLDYLAIPKDNPDLVASLVEGVAQGCTESGAALLGGETAVMPDIYAADDFDMAGFCVGVVERKEIIDGSTAKPGDVVIGLASSGLHSNGFSLIRSAVFGQGQLAIDATVPELETTVAQALLTPTRIYVKPVLAVLEQARKGIRGMAHITGGGIADNLVRVIPAGCRAVLDRTAWTVPPVFGWVQRLGEIDTEEMFRVFNMGIGFTLVAKRKEAETIQRTLKEHGVDSWVIGEIIAGEQGVEYKAPSSET